MRSKFSQIGLAHRLPKIHKDYQYDTTSTPHYCIEKILSSLLNALTINNYSVKESFEGAKRIQFIPPELFNQEHKFISFDVTSLFINVSSKKKLRNDDKVVPTTLRKRAMKKLILDACTKTLFSFKSKF